MIVTGVHDPINGGFLFNGPRFLRNRGDGTFAPPENLSVANAESIASDAANFDLGGENTMLVSCYAWRQNTVAYDLHRDGKWNVHQVLQPLNSCTPVLARFFSNSSVDLIVGHRVDIQNDPVEGMTIFRGDGKGGFFAPKRRKGPQVLDLAVADLNNDRKPDLIAVADGGEPRVVVYLNNTKDDTGDWPFPEDGKSFLCGPTPGGVATGDFDGDGNVDVVVTSAYNHTLTILLGRGDGSFESTISLPGPFGAPPLVADLLTRGRSDIVVCDEGGAPPHAAAQYDGDERCGTDEPVIKDPGAYEVAGHVQRSRDAEFRQTVNRGRIDLKRPSPE